MREAGQRHKAHVDASWIYTIRQRQNKGHGHRIGEKDNSRYQPASVCVIPHSVKKIGSRAENVKEPICVNACAIQTVLIRKMADVRSAGIFCAPRNTPPNFGEATLLINY